MLMHQQFSRSHKVTQTAANSNDVLGPQTPPCGSHEPNISHNQEPPGPHTITHNNEKIALVLFLASGFAIWNMFQ